MSSNKVMKLVIILIVVVCLAYLAYGSGFRVGYKQAQTRALGFYAQDIASSKKFFKQAIQGLVFE